jgi:acyl-homoserine lactone acylase PvdQ
MDPSNNPHVINPAKGYIATANNRPASSNSTFEANYPGTGRAFMIHQILDALIASGNPLTIQDVLKL